MHLVFFRLNVFDSKRCLLADRTSKLYGSISSYLYDIMIEAVLPHLAHFCKLHCAPLQMSPINSVVLATTKRELVAGLLDSDLDAIKAALSCRRSFMQQPMRDVKRALDEHEATAAAQARSKTNFKQCKEVKSKQINTSRRDWFRPRNAWRRAEADKRQLQLSLSSSSAPAKLARLEKELQTSPRPSTSRASIEIITID